MANDRASSVRSTAAMRSPDEVLGSLKLHELPWRERQPMLERRGYMLRPRLRPEWIPSWRGTGKHPLECEDGLVLPVRDHLVDATRIADGALVYVKRVQTAGTELQIASMFSSEHLRNDPKNHCVPILDAFQDDGDDSSSYMVMPFLRAIDEPAFELVDDVISFADQILEGLVFLHQHGVAHRDCTHGNILMDASAMYPMGFHPVNDMYLPDAQTSATPLPRSTIPVKYYFVDFGISSLITSDVHTKLVLGDAGQDREVPELSNIVPYDPFKVDIFLVANVLRRSLHDKYSNLNFLSPLISTMTDDDPAARPDAEEALRRWGDIRVGLGTFQRRWWLIPRDANWVSILAFNVASSVGATVYLVKWLLGWEAHE